MAMGGSLLIILIMACDKWDFDRTSFTQVITVGALEVGFNSAFLLGDIEGLRNTQISETGFVISSMATDEQALRLSQPNVMLAMSPRLEDSIINEDRAFAARADDLNASTTYFFRAFITLEEGVHAYGAIDTFTTSNLTISAPSVIKSSTDCEGSSTITVRITGITPSPRTSFGIVWSDDVNDRSPSLSTSTSIIASELNPDGDVAVQLPIQCNTVFFVRGFYQASDIEIYGPVTAFTTTPTGAWISAGEFPEDFDRETCLHSFSSQTTGFAIGLNRDQTKWVLWQFNPQDESWAIASDPPSSISATCSRSPAVLGRFLFSVSGLTFSEYLPNTDQWIPFDLTFSGQGAGNSSQFSFLHKGVFFWGTGIDLVENMTSSSVFAAFDGGAATRLADYPGGGRHQTTYFVLNSRGYVGLGRDVDDQFFRDFWSLDFDSRSWSAVADIPEEINSDNVFTSEEHAYILTGFDADNTPLPNFYKYGPQIDQWIRLADFGRGDGNADIGFVIDGVIYGGVGISTSGELRREMWRYIPELK